MRYKLWKLGTEVNQKEVLNQLYMLIRIPPQMKQRRDSVSESELSETSLEYTDAVQKFCQLVVNWDL